MSQSDAEPHDRLRTVLKHSQPDGLELTNRMTSEEMIHELALVFQELQTKVLGLLGEVNHLRNRALRKV